MSQVLLRAVHLLRRPAVLAAGAAIGIGGSALVGLPLFGVPGYELGCAIAAGVGVLGGVIGAAAAFQERRLIQGQDPRPARAVRSDSALAATLAALGAAVVLNLAAATPPFLVSVAYALTSSPCNPMAQAAFYPLLVVPSALLAAAAGVFCGLSAGGPLGAALRYALLLLAAAAATCWPLYFGPQVYAYNHFAGFFPGPLYDEALAIHAPLGWFRAETVLLAVSLWLLTACCLDMRRGRAGWPKLRPAAFVLLGLSLSGVALLEDQAPRLGTRMTAEHLEERLGSAQDTEHFRLVYPRGKPREEVARLVRDLEFRYAQVAAFLGGGPAARIHVYLYRSTEEKAALVGAASTQFAKPWRLELHVNDGPFPLSALKHELVHAMAQPYGTSPFGVTTRLGVIPQMAVIEGVAVAGDNPVSELSLHEWAAGMRREKLAPDLRALFQPQGFYAHAAARAYTYAGSFIRYLADTYGQQKLQALYGHGDFQGTYGRTLESLAAEWEAVLDKLPLSAAATHQAFGRFHQGSLFERPCAREVVELAARAQEDLRSDPELARETYQRCATLQPGEPSFRLGQASALQALGRNDEARQELEAVAAEVEHAPALLTEVLMAQVDLDVQMKRRPEAVTALQRILSLGGSAGVDRAARIKLAALTHHRAESALWTYFQPGHDDVKLLILRDALAASPEDPILLYLLGRRLEQAGAPTLATGYLTRALGGDLPPSLREEALRLKIEGDYLAGDCEGVKNDAGHLPDLGGALKFQAVEWLRRCDFEAIAFHGPLVPADAFR